MLHYNKLIPVTWTYVRVSLFAYKIHGVLHTEPIKKATRRCCYCCCFNLYLISLPLQESCLSLQDACTSCKRVKFEPSPHKNLHTLLVHFYSSVPSPDRTVPVACAPKVTRGNNAEQNSARSEPQTTDVCITLRTKAYVQQKYMYICYTDRQRTDI